MTQSFIPIMMEYDPTIIKKKVNMYYKNDYIGDIFYPVTSNIYPAEKTILVNPQIDIIPILQNKNLINSINKDFIVPENINRTSLKILDNIKLDQNLITNINKIINTDESTTSINIIYPQQQVLNYNTSSALIIKSLQVPGYSISILNLLNKLPVYNSAGDLVKAPLVSHLRNLQNITGKSSFIIGQVTGPINILLSAALLPFKALDLVNAINNCNK